MQMKSIWAIGLCCAVVAVASAQDEEAPPPVQFTPLRGDLTLITHSYPNMVVLAGDDGLLMVDAGLKANADALMAAIEARFPGKPVRHLINTHVHGDHTGGNAALIARGAEVLVHENTRKAMDEVYYLDAEGNEVDEASKGTATRDFELQDMPAYSYPERVNVHFAGERIEVFHPGNAHTPGDSLVYFHAHNAIALGDNYFGNAYTFGGNIEGMIGVYRQVLERIDDDTLILPGHGVVASKKDLSDYLDMLLTVKARVDAARAAGRSADEVAADASITAEYEEKYGGLYIAGDRFRRLVYNNGF